MEHAQLAAGVRPVRGRRRPGKHDAVRKPTVGREAIKQRIGVLAQDISKIELQIRHIGVADGVVFIDASTTSCIAAITARVPVVGVLEVEQGRVKAWREYYDRAQMIEAMGLKQDFDARAARVSE